MSFKLIAFRCPEDLLTRIDNLASATNSSRSVVLAESVRIFAEDVRARGGFVVPPFTDEEIAGIAAKLGKKQKKAKKKEL